MKGNAESRKLYKKYKGKRIGDGLKFGTVIGWCNESCWMVAELDEPHGWEYVYAASGIYSDDKLKEGDWYWYIVESDIIK